jgi:hypothetical protein
MTTYQDLHWDSLDFIKRHLYRRLATPLNNALGRLAIARHVDDPAEAREQFRRVEQNLEIALNLVKAWAALVHVKSGGAIRRAQRRQITPDGFPAWLVEHLNTQTAFLIEHTQPVLVHPETFYESLMLMCLICAGVGTLKKLVTYDALNDSSAIWIRTVFEPPSSGSYDSLGALFNRFNTQTPAGQDITFQLQVLQEFLRINGVTLRLQNNRRSGEQALAVCLPAAAATIQFVPAAKDKAQETQETMVAHLRRQPANGKPPNAREPEAVENRSETLIVPPPNLHERLAAHLKETPAPGEVEIENKPQTRLLPPPNFPPKFRDGLRERAQEADGAAAENTPPGETTEIENKPETLIVPPPNLHEQLSQQLAQPIDAESTPPTKAPEVHRPVTGPFNRPPDPGVIEVVEPENASDTLIVPPPDYKRRLGLQQTPRPGRYAQNGADHPASGEESEGQDVSAPSD